MIAYTNPPGRAFGEDRNRLINRTLVYASPTLMLALLYVGAIVLSQRVLIA